MMDYMHVLGLLLAFTNWMENNPIPVSIMNNVNTSVGEEEYTLYGKSSITEILRGLTFQISANSFFQKNTSQAEVLYELIEDCAGLRGDGSEIILDLFCGTGTIGLTLARGAKHVYGYEVVSHHNLLLREILAILAFLLLAAIKLVKEETWEAFIADTLFFAKGFLIAVALVMDYHLALCYMVGFLGIIRFSSQILMLMRWIWERMQSTAFVARVIC